jgi:hypothetical protein
MGEGVDEGATVTITRSSFYCLQLFEQLSLGLSIAINNIYG